MYEYRSRFHLLRISKGYTKEHIPRLYTIEGSRGSEAKIAILDLVVTDATNAGQGFTKDKKRCNVAFTHGKQAICRLIRKTRAAGMMTRLSRRSRAIGMTPRRLIDNQPRVTEEMSQTRWLTEKIRRG